MNLPLSPRERRVLAGILVLHTAFVCCWYASGPSGPIPATDAWAVFVRRCWMFPASALYGIAIGYFVQRACFAWTVGLTVVLAVWGAILHLVAAHLGVPVDWGSPAGGVAIAVITLVLFLPVSLLGASAGWKLRSQRRA